MKLTKISIVFVLVLFAGLTLNACSDFLGVNKDPNTINEANESLRLGGLLGEFSYEIMGATGTRFTAMWTQQIANNNNPPTEDNYDINSTDVNNLWFAAYSDAMINAQKLAKVAAENGNYDYVAIGKTILAWSAIYTTNLWGDIPYSESLKGGKNIKPKYDSQESIYKAAQTLLDEALAALEKQSSRSPGVDDLLYSGDMTKWKRLIYTLKARWYMNLSRAPGYSEAEQAQKALKAIKNGFQSNADNATFKYYAEPGSHNPWYQFTISGKWFDTYRLSKHYVQLLKSLNDPRLAVQARQNVNGEYRGHPNGAPPVNNALISEIGVFYSAKDAELIWLTYAEAKFIEAEATLITEGPNAAASIFKDAVMASMKQLGIPADERNTYIKSLPSLTSGNALKLIMTQKYIANYLNIQNYNDLRRTGYPKLTPVDNGYVDIIPLRFVVPNAEINYNLENLKATGIPLGQEAMTVPVWWDSADK